MSSKEKQVDPLKEAQHNKEKGDSSFKSSCISCRFKPDIHSAIPSYKLAANQYHNLRDYKEEIYCREKLTFCFRSLSSEWEEGKEYEQIAFIYLNNLSEPENAFKAIQNSHQGYFIRADYDKSITSLEKLSQNYLTLNLPDYAHRCLKLAYDDCLTVFHTLVVKKDVDYDFVYKCFDTYLSLLFKLNLNDEVIATCDQILKVIKPYETKKSKIMRFFAYKMLVALTNNEKMNYEVFKSEANNAIIEYNNSDVIEAVEDCNNYINNLDDIRFKRALKLLEAYFDIEIVKKVKSIFDLKMKQNKPVDVKDIKLNTNNQTNQVNIEIISQNDEDDYT